MKPQTIFPVAAIALTTLAALPAEAHVLAAGAGSLGHGFAHPFTGLDHVLAMIAVGLWAAHLGGRARWLVPASFVAVMAAAGGLGMAGASLPNLETAIALTVVALGALIFTRARLPLAVGMALTGSFAMFHGLAHGLAAPDAAGLAYGLGFMAATAFLHALGLMIGWAASRPGGLALLPARLGGGVAVAAGVLLMVV